MSPHPIKKGTWICLCDPSHKTYGKNDSDTPWKWCEACGSSTRLEEEQLMADLRKELEEAQEKLRLVEHNASLYPPEKQIEILQNKIDELGDLYDKERDASQKFVDLSCYYRNLAIKLGAKPDDMLNRYDRMLVEKRLLDNEEIGNAPELWEEIEKLEGEIERLKAGK
jgi:hypothetical protein